MTCPVLPASSRDDSAIMRRSRGRDLRRRRVRAMRRLARLSERRNATPAGKPPVEEPWEALGSVPESRAKPASTRDFESSARTAEAANLRVPPPPPWGRLGRGEVGRGKPRFGARQSSFASPPYPPPVRGRGIQCALRLTAACSMKPFVPLHRVQNEI